MDSLGFENFCKTQGLQTIGGLIQNDRPLTLNEATEINTQYILRWRFRICQNTGKGFDITQRGFTYNGEYNG
tara:strand:+ start:449 stop:664 length:216 start_codon:yes stop_codon:yes gene_type:complete